MKPERSGGSFDPTGARSVDVGRADDLVTMCEALRHRRCVAVCLTLRRDLFLSPALAYERAQERVSKVLTALGRINASTIEVQGKTGEGWIHWHALVFVEDGAGLGALRQLVRSMWSVRERISDEVVDSETGEVLQPARLKDESLGRTDVQWARSHGGAARYAAKYMVKRWPAVPSWMLDSARRFRKYRFSEGAYEVLERLHLHDRHRGSRRPVAGRRWRVRTLRERMARSCLSTLVFQDQGGKPVYVGRLSVALLDVASVPGVVPVKLGRLGSVRLSAPAAVIADLVKLEADPAYQVSRNRQYRQRLDELDSAWSMMQRLASERGGELGDPSADGGACGPANEH